MRSEGVTSLTGFGPTSMIPWRIEDESLVDSSHEAARKRVVAVVGATGAVGEVLLRVLAERRFPVGELRALASQRSAGSKLGLREWRPPHPSRSRHRFS